MVNRVTTEIYLDFEVHTQKKIVFQLDESKPVN